MSTWLVDGSCMSRLREFSHRNITQVWHNENVPDSQLVLFLDRWLKLWCLDSAHGVYRDSRAPEMACLRSIINLGLRIIRVPGRQLSFLSFRPVERDRNEHDQRLRCSGPEPN